MMVMMEMKNIKDRVDRIKRYLNKNGSISVLLAMMFTSMLILVAAFVHAFTGIANYSYSDAILQIGGRSVLSEFHRGLKDAYGLMAFNDYYGESYKKMEFYIEECLKGKRSRGRFAIMKPEPEGIFINMDDYAIVNEEIFDKEIKSVMLHPDLFKKDGMGKSDESEGILRNRKVISELPSKKIMEADGGLRDILPNIPDLKNVGEQILLDKYIFRFFNSYAADRSRVASFFKNEIEYIIYGRLSDDENKQRFLRDFKILRLGLNSLHIYSSPEKMDMVTALAETLTPGPQAAITAIIVAEAWALAETVNDTSLLLNEKNVDLHKNRDTWAVNLESIKDRVFDISSRKESIKDKKEEGKGESYLSPKSDRGLSYEGYLKLILAAQKKEKKMYRVMDLIQINMQGSIDPEFHMEECYTGLEYKVKMGGREHSNVHTY